jgi:hypothetical protein
MRPVCGSIKRNSTLSRHLLGPRYPETAAQCPTTCCAAGQAVAHHTAIPLLHFWTKSFGLACRWLGKAGWTDERNLILMSRRHLASLPGTSLPSAG